MSLFGRRRKKGGSVGMEGSGVTVMPANIEYYDETLRRIVSQPESARLGDELGVDDAINLSNKLSAFAGSYLMKGMKKFTPIIPERGVMGNAAYAFVTDMYIEATSSLMQQREKKLIELYSRSDVSTAELINAADATYVQMRELMGIAPSHFIKEVMGFIGLTTSEVVSRVARMTSGTDVIKSEKEVAVLPLAPAVATRPAAGGGEGGEEGEEGED